MSRGTRVREKEEVELVKPGTLRPYIRERRFSVIEELWDDLGGTLQPRFHRCRELTTMTTSLSSTRNGRQFLILLSKERAGRSWLNDLNMLSQLRNPYILGYQDAWESRGIQHVLCEDARMFLSVCLRKMASSDQPKPSKQLFPRWLYHIISALEYLHDQNVEDQPVLHRAVQPDNILVTEHCVLQLCAFHTSKRLKARETKTGSVFGGGGLFQSPEARAGGTYDQAVDVWGFGVTAVYIANFTPAGKAISADRLRKLVENSGQDPEAVAMVQNALVKQPSRRQTASQIAKYFRDHYGEAFLNSSPSPHSFPAPLVNTLSQSSPAHSDNSEGPNSAPHRQPGAPRGQKSSSKTSAQQSERQHNLCRRVPARPTVPPEEEASCMPQGPGDAHDRPRAERPPNFSNNTASHAGLTESSSRPAQDVPAHSAVPSSSYTPPSAEVPALRLSVGTDTQTSLYEPGAKTVQNTSTQTSQIRWHQHVHHGGLAEAGSQTPAPDPTRAGHGPGRKKKKSSRKTPGGIPAPRSSPVVSPASSSTVSCPTDSPEDGSDQLNTWEKYSKLLENQLNLDNSSSTPTTPVCSPHPHPSRLRLQRTTLHPHVDSGRRGNRGNHYANTTPLAFPQHGRPNHWESDTEDSDAKVKRPGNADQRRNHARSCSDNPSHPDRDTDPKPFTPKQVPRESWYHEDEDWVPEQDDARPSQRSTLSPGTLSGPKSRQGSTGFGPDVMRKISECINNRTKKDDQQVKPRRKSSRSAERGDLDLGRDTGEGDLAEGGRGQWGKSLCERTSGLPTGFLHEQSDDDLSDTEAQDRASRGQPTEAAAAEDCPQYPSPRGNRYPPSGHRHHLRVPKNARAARQVTPRPRYYHDLPVDTDGTSGLGDSCHSQELYDCC